MDQISTTQTKELKTKRDTFAIAHLQSTLPLKIQQLQCLHYLSKAFGSRKTSFWAQFSGLFEMSNLSQAPELASALFAETVYICDWHILGLRSVSWQKEAKVCETSNLTSANAFLCS